MLAAIVSSHEIHHLIGQYGYAAVLVFVMLESIGVPWPGETMLIAASLYAGTTHNLQPELIWAAAAAGAIVGDNIGFAIGHWGGYRLLRRYGHKLRIDERRIKIGRYVFDRHGGKVVFFGRFVSILRTYAAFLAGTNRMNWWRFFAFNAAGGIVWSGIYSFGYYYLGNTLKGVSTPVDIAIGVIVALLVIGSLVWVRRNEERFAERAERAYPGPLADEPPPGEDSSNSDRDAA